MFEIAFIIGIYSYLVFALGILGILYKNNIIAATIIYLGFVLFYLFKTKKILKPAKINFDKISVFLIFLVILQVLINLIGVLGPEISFDSLWYHLTLPKLYLINHSISHISGGLLYYSDMPKLTEMLYVAGISLANETLAKIIHFSFGLLILFSIYKISRKFLSEKFSLIAVLIFYSSLVVGWESITAYVDLSRTFFELMAFWGFLNWIEKRNYKWIAVSGLMLGLAITTKIVAVSSIAIFLALFLYDAFLKKRGITKLVKEVSVFVFLAVIVPLPWFIFSLIHTSNPFYPAFSKNSLDVGQVFVLPHFQFVLKDIYNFFLNLNDPISPLYLILLPVIIIVFRKFDSKGKLLLLYSSLAIVIWYLALEKQGGRFIMPYLPVVSILTAYSIDKLKDKKLELIIMIAIVVVGLSSIFYRGLANKKYIPVLLGRESKSEFLAKNLNFSFGDFYDTDGYFARMIKSSDRVLLLGFHNLYYVNFPFIDSSWVKKGDKFNYIAVQNSIIPDKFSDWKEIYYNKMTKIKLYSKGGETWVY